MNERDQRRVRTLNRVLEGTVTAVDAAEQLGLSERQVRRILAAYRKEGAAAIPHHNRGRPPKHALAAVIRQRVVALSRTVYAETNDRHFRDLLAEREGIVLSPSAVARLRRAAGAASPRRRRPPAHRQRRARRAQAGMLLQIDGSPHDWLDGRGPRLTRRAAIDDATGTVAGAVWRDQEASTGYLQLLAQIVTTHGCPEAVYHERSGLFVHHDHERETIAEQLAGAREPRQVMRAFGALGIASITAHSPQAKSRIERLFGTLQDRLVVELRLAGAATLAEATRVLAAYLPRFHAQFGVPAADPTVAYRPLPAAVDLRQVWCVTQRRVVANDDTIQIEGQRLQLLPGRARLSYVRATVEVRDHLDGGRSVWYQEHEIAWRPAPPDARAVRPRPGTAVGMAAGGAAARSPTGGQPPAQTEAAPSVVPAPQTSRR